MDVSIIIVNWNTRDLLRKCLAAVSQHVHALKYEMIVVDNASKDDSIAMVRAEFPSVQLIENQENVGFARANNQAMRVSKGEFLLLLNSDAFVQTGTIQTLVHALRNTHKAGAAGGLLVNVDGTFQSSYYDFPTLISELLTLAGLNRQVYWPEHPSHPARTAHEQVARVDWVMGANFLVRREAVDAVGLLDESYFMYAEEMDWLYRMRKAGWHTMYVPTAITTHVGSASNTIGSPRKRINLAQSKVLFFRKHYAPWKAFALYWGGKLIAFTRMLAFAPMALIPSKRAAAKVRMAASWAMLVDKPGG